MLIMKFKKSILSNNVQWCAFLNYNSIKKKKKKKHFLLSLPGVIVSTPTGSTAYAVAAGASMIHPNVPAIMITPICPHSLSFRPIVVPAGVELKVNPQHLLLFGFDCIRTFTESFYDFRLCCPVMPETRPGCLLMAGNGRKLPVGTGKWLQHEHVNIHFCKHSADLFKYADKKCRVEFVSRCVLLSYTFNPMIIHSVWVGIVKSSLNHEVLTCPQVKLLITYYQHRQQYRYCQGCTGHRDYWEIPGGRGLCGPVH